MDEAPIITTAHRTQLERLLASWELRARANMFGAESEVLRTNIVALKSVLNSLDLVYRFEEALKVENRRAEDANRIIEGVRGRLDEFGAFRGPRPKRADMTVLAHDLISAYRVLDDVP